MRIDPNLSVTTAAVDHMDPAGEKKTAPVKPASGLAAASVVDLSEAAQAVAPRETRPSITARIEKIRGLIERGTYPVDLDVLASRIIDDEVGRASKAS